MSPFEAARKLLDADSAKLSISAKSDLVFQVHTDAYERMLALPQKSVHLWSDSS